jgi:hypothetical protein
VQRPRTSDLSGQLDAELAEPLERGIEARASGRVGLCLGPQMIDGRAGGDEHVERERLLRELPEEG